MNQIHFTTPLGKASVEFTDHADYLKKLREYGQMGWTSVELGSGLMFPLSEHDEFDFSLIGARQFTNGEGETCLMWRGQIFKQRVLEEIDTKKLKLPKIIKYSRGARPTDPESIKEGEDTVRYITLITFRGNGRPNPQHLKPAPGHVNGAKPAAQAAQAAQVGPVSHKTTLESRAGMEKALFEAHNQKKIQLPQLLKQHNVSKITDLSDQQVSALYNGIKGA